MPASHGNAAVQADHAVPWHVLRGGCEHVPDEASHAGFDVAVSLDEAFGDRSNPSKDSSGAVVSH